MCRIFSRYLRQKTSLIGIKPIICINFTLVLLQECHIFTLVLLQTFDTILIYWQFYTWPNPTLM